MKRMWHLVLVLVCSALVFGCETETGDGNGDQGGQTAQGGQDNQDVADPINIPLISAIGVTWDCNRNAEIWQFVDWAEGPRKTVYGSVPNSNLKAEGTFRVNGPTISWTLTWPGSRVVNYSGQFSKNHETLRGTMQVRGQSATSFTARRRSGVNVQ